MTTEYNLCLTRTEFLSLFALIAVLVFAAFFDAGLNATGQFITWEQYNGAE